MKDQTHRLFRLVAALLMCLGLVACASTPGDDDPWKNWNQGTQSFNDSVDKNLLKPVAKGYHWITPKFVDDSVSNAFGNIGDLGAGINSLLQWKLAKSGQVFGRFLVNSTVGIGGLLDAGELMGLSKQNEDFGQTLAVWGVPAGPYLVLPFYGPSSPRDAFGLLGDAAMNPLTYVSIFGGTEAAGSTAGSKFVEILDKRSDLLTKEKILNEAAGEDRYEFLKKAYQQQRDFLIRDGKGKAQADDIDQDLDALEKEEQAAKPATRKP